MPKFRSGRFATWRACERFGILPPDVKRCWDDCNPWIKASLLAYEEVCEHDKNERDVEFAKAMTPQIPG